MFTVVTGSPSWVTPASGSNVAAIVPPATLMLPMRLGPPGSCTRLSGFDPTEFSPCCSQAKPTTVSHPSDPLRRATRFSRHRRTSSSCVDMVR